MADRERSLAARQTLTWAMAGLLLIAPLAGCAQPTPTPEPVIIRFAHLQDDAKYYEALAKKYHEANSNVTIQLLSRNYGTLQQLKAADVDVFFLASVTQRRKQGDLLSLDPWLTQDDEFAVADFVPGALSLFAAEGKTWAIPATIDPLLMFYNRDLFDKYGIDHPKVGWTWDDFLATALSLRHADPTVYGYGFTLEGADPILFIYQHGGSIVDDLKNPTRVTLDDPLTIEAVDWFGRLVLEYDVAPGPEQAVQLFGGDRSYAVYRGVYGGKVGLWCGNYSSQGGRGWPVTWPFKWGVATLPRDKYGSTFATVSALGISSQARQPEACWRWISFLSRQLPNQFVPARTSLLESKAYTQSIGEENAEVVRAAMKDIQLPTEEDLSGFEPVFRVFWQALDDVVSGRASAQEAMSQAQNQAAKLVP